MLQVILDTASRVSAEILSHEITVVVCLAILGWGAIATFRFHRRFSPLLRDFREKHALLEQKCETEEGFAEFFDELDESFRGSPVLRHSWHEFTETLILPEFGMEDAAPSVRNTASPDRFFNRYTLLEPRLNLRLYNTLPNLFTGAGILGTFVGLVYGISQASGGLASGDIEEAQVALSSLLNGAWLAFMTSIFGLATSLMFSYWEKHRIHQFDQTCSDWVEALDKRLQRVTPEKLANDSLMELRQQSTTFTQFTNDLAFQIGEQFNSQVTSHLTPALDALYGEIHALRTEQQNASEEVLREIVDQFSKTISASAGKEMEAFAETVKTMGQSLESQISAMSENHERMQAESQQTIESLSETFRESSRRLNEELADAVRNLVSEISQTVADMTQELRSATETTTSNMRHIVESFDNSVGNLRSTIETMRDLTSNSESLAEQMSELLEGVDRSHQAITDVISHLDAVGSGIKESVSTLSTAGTGIEESVSRLEQSNITVVAAQEQTRQLWDNYEQRFAEVDQSLAKVFDSLQDGLSDYAKATDSYVQGLDEHTAGIVKQLAGAVNQLEDVLSEFSEEVVERT
ncbi:anti-phage ZorAB system protein ZorA [Pseudomonadota bacterium 24LQ007]